MVDDAHVIVNRAAVARADLAARRSRRCSAQSSTREVVVRCADGVTHGAFVGVLDEAKRCGATHIAVVAS